MNVHFDVETRSEANLPDVGAHRYACDPTTVIFMCAVAEQRPDATVYLWINPLFRDAGVESDPQADELIHRATTRFAFNAPFEQAIFWGTRQFGAVPVESWRCTQAVARIAGMPDSLEKCGEALDIDCKKDRRGKDLIKFFSIPREDGKFNEPRDHKEKWMLFCDYCRQDVRAEREIHHKLDKAFGLRGLNLETFLFTMRMNQDGIPVNVLALRNAQRIVDEVTSGASEEFRRLTGVNITQRAKVLEWLHKRGVMIENMQADTLQSLDAKSYPAEVGRVITLYIQLSYAATKKIATMLDWACPDGCMRGVLKFYGAGTGRWSAGGPQIQNAKKATPEMRPITKAAYKYISNGGTAAGLDAVYGDSMEVLASCIRHFVHRPGFEMLDGDYNAIEARVICWLAGESERLAMWAKGADLYRWMASLIYGVPESQVNGDMRDMGKRTILGCGYGMGAAKFLSTCELFGAKCDAELAERSVTTYRENHPKIVQFWRGLQSGVEQALINLKQPYRVGKILIWTDYAAGRLYLFLQLPSGRRLAYPDPKSEPDPKFGQQITYWGQLPMTTQWGRIKLYGGKLAENCIGEGTEVLTQRGWIPIEQVRDDDDVWDGEAWVGHDGVICKGDQPVIEFAGVKLTPDHEVFEENGKITAEKACADSALKIGEKSWQNLDFNSKAKFLAT